MTWTSTSGSYTLPEGGDYITIAPNTTYTTTRLDFNNLVNQQMKHYARELERQLYEPSTILEHLKKHKENTMSDTHKAVAKARLEAKEAQAKQLLDHIEAEIGQYAPLRPGALINAQVRFPDRDKVYQYAWIKGERYWYRTYSTTEYSTEDVVDELVRLVMDSTSCQWELVGAAEDDGGN